MALAETLHSPDLLPVGIELKVRATAGRYFDDFKVFNGENWAESSKPPSHQRL
tara:strand:- start:429 stop:587 length:159 start_codon:yes stop_codon:yes gene_type:complete